jgi:hypothetical protein
VFRLLAAEAANVQIAARCTALLPEMRRLAFRVREEAFAAYAAPADEISGG